MRELHTNPLQKINKGLSNDWVLDVNSRQQLRDDIDPDFKVDGLETLPDDLLNLEDVSVTEPELQKSQCILQCLRCITRVVVCLIMRQRQLLDKTLHCTDDMIDVFLAKHLLASSGMST